MTSEANGEDVQETESKSEGANETAASGAPEGNVEPQASASVPPQADVEALTQERDKLKDQLLRTAADFDNFRKRSKRDLEDSERRGREEILNHILPVMDNLERAVAAAESATDVAAVAEGVRMVLKQYEDVCGRIGIERVATVGERFDPNLHDAIQQAETAEHPPGTVIAEIMPGYRMNERLVRAALVVVARAPAGGSEDDDEADDAGATDAEDIGAGDIGAGDTVSEETNADEAAPEE